MVGKRVQGLLIEQRSPDRVDLVRHSPVEVGLTCFDHEVAALQAGVILYSYSGIDLTDRNTDSFKIAGADAQ